MMELVEAMNMFGKSAREEEQPKMTILSGTSCIMIRDLYRIPTRNDFGHRILAFNDKNSLEEPPNDSYVFKLPYKFPGTIVTLRFYLDPNELIGSPE